MKQCISLPKSSLGISERSNSFQLLFKNQFFFFVLAVLVGLGWEKMSNARRLTTPCASV